MGQAVGGWRGLPRRFFIEMCNNNILPDGEHWGGIASGWVREEFQLLIVVGEEIPLISYSPDIPSRCLGSRCGG